MPKSKTFGNPELWGSSNPVFGRRHFPLYILHKMGDIWLEMPASEKMGIRNLEILKIGSKILCWEGVIFLYRLFTKSVIWGSKYPKSGKSKIWSRLLMISLCMLEAFFPTTLVDGFSKLWLLGKGNLGLVLISAGS